MGVLEGCGADLLEKLRRDVEDLRAEVAAPDSCAADLRGDQEGFAGEGEDALTSFAKENKEAMSALGQLDGPYRVGRSAIAAMLGRVALPDTLKSQPTDTDMLNAIERLVDVIDGHAGTPWADNLLQGELGTQAPRTVKELTEAIAANKVLGKAQLDRAAAYGPAYEAYLGFKRVVRDALGPSSKEYKRIHLRASPVSSGEDPAAKPDAATNDAAPPK